MELILKNYHKEDSIKVDILIEIFLNKNLIYGKQDSIYVEHREALRISENIGYKRGEARSLIRLADKFNVQSKTDSALIFSLKAVEIFENLFF